MLYTSNTFVTYNHPLKEADVVFLGIPFASGSTSKPAIYGPLVVRESLKLIEGTTKGKQIFEKLKVCDLGDLEVAHADFAETAKRIKETIKEIREESKAFPVFVGGDHSITLPVVEAMRPKTIIQFDAHTDLAKHYMGSEHNHGTWAYEAFKTLKAELIQVGVTSWHEGTAEFARKNRIKEYSVNEFRKLKKNFKKPVHVTFDIDVLEGVVTGYPEGTARLHDILPILQKLKCSSFDLVEVADDHLPSNTGFAASHIIKAVLEGQL